MSTINRQLEKGNETFICTLLFSFIRLLRIVWNFCRIMDVTKGKSTNLESSLVNTVRKNYDWFQNGCRKKWTLKLILLI